MRAKPSRSSSSFETRARAFESAELFRHTRSSGRGRASRAAKLTIQTALPVAVARAGWSDPCIFLFFCGFGIFHLRSHDLKHTHTSSFPRRVFAPGVLHRCFTDPESRGGRSAESRSGAAAPAGPAHDAAGQAPSEAPCVP